MRDDYIVIYAVVPRYIYETKLLTPEEKLIAERIIYLCKKEGYCWITNKSLAEMYHITVDTASKHIKKLEKIGLIKCIYDHNDKNTKRIIQLVEDIWNNWSIRDRSNERDNIDYSNKHNNKYNKKIEYEDNRPKWMDHPEMCKSEPMTPEELAEFEELLAEFK